MPDQVRHDEERRGVTFNSVAPDLIRGPPFLPPSRCKPRHRHSGCDGGRHESDHPHLLVQCERLRFIGDQVAQGAARTEDDPGQAGPEVRLIPGLGGSESGGGAHSIDCVRRDRVESEGQAKESEQQREESHPSDLMVFVHEASEAVSTAGS